MLPDEALARQKEREAADTVSFFASLIGPVLVVTIASVSGFLLYKYILAPLAWKELVAGVISVLRGRVELATLDDELNELGERFHLARVIAATCGAIVAGLIASAFWLAVELRRKAMHLDRVNARTEARINDVVEKIDRIATLIDNLENRHNVIQGGTEYGRVLALRDFANHGLRENDSWYNNNLTGDHCIVSTLVLERAEELLTSEEYMSFFVDLTLPANGYFRLVLARQPKHWEGLSAYGAISKKLGYKTAIVSRSTWNTCMKPALRSLGEDVCGGLVQLVERNTEVGIKGAQLKDLRRIALQDAMYCGRLAKLEDERRSGESTIATFVHPKPIKGIPNASICAYWRLLGLLSDDYTMTSFDSKALAKRFGDFGDDLRRDIGKLFPRPHV